MIQTISLIILSVLSTSFAFLFYIERKKKIKILAQTLQFFVMQEEQQKQNKTDKEQFNEDFLKFISDSRDWAYSYIEDVQLGLNKFISDIEPEISYFDEYGAVGTAYPHYHSMKKISSAYKELKNLIPEDYDRIE
jgi:hypothetical protein